MIGVDCLHLPFFKIIQFQCTNAGVGGHDLSGSTPSQKVALNKAFFAFYLVSEVTGGITADCFTLLRPLHTPETYLYLSSAVCSWYLLTLHHVYRLIASPIKKIVHVVGLKVTATAHEIENMDEYCGDHHV